MKLSAPVYRLKRDARLLSRKEGVPLHAALDRIAVMEGFESWSLLASRLSAAPQSAKLLARLRPGDTVLIGARPGHGKTRLGLQLAVEAMKNGRKAAFFTLEYTKRHVLDLFRAIDEDPATYRHGFTLDTSDDICADHIMARLSDAPRETVAVVDYLQLLDQKRGNPELSAQVAGLRDFARAREIVVVFISQIDRAFETSGKELPGPEDVRMPNPVDLSLFNTTCFLNNGEITFAQA